MKTLSGRAARQSGRVRFDGEDITHVAVAPAGRARASARRPRAAGIFPGMTVAENLEMGAYMRRDRKSSAKPPTSTCVRRCSRGCAERRKQTGGTMSGGEQQMLAIGRALMAAPAAAAARRAVDGSRADAHQQIFAIITEINGQGTTVLLVEQNAAQALRRAHRAYVLETGRIVQEGTGGDAAARRRGAGRVPRRQRRVNPSAPC